MGNFATIAGALASVVAVAAAIQQVTARRRRHVTVSNLEREVRRLLRLRQRLHAWLATVAQDTDVNDHCAGYVAYYAGTSDELERTIAEIRSIDAEGAHERLRSDVELLARCLLRQWDNAATHLPSGSLKEGLRHPFGFHAIDRAKHVDTASEEREVVLLLRSIMHRLHRVNHAEVIDLVLPLDPHHVYNLDQMWGAEVRPLR